MSAHPSELDLDQFRDAGDPDPAIAAHLAGCVDCQTLLATLRALTARPKPLEVPASVDEHVIEAAWSTGRRIRGNRRRRATLVVAGGFLAAAAALLVLWRPAEVPPQVAAGPADIDRDGRVDILDAFSMARALDAHQAPRPEWDLNGDGVVDRADVEAVARAAVLVGGGG